MDNFLEIVESNKRYFGYPNELQTLLMNSGAPIKYIDELKHLKTINISGDNCFDSVQDEIYDYEDLNKFEELETLIISNNENIEKLNISNLKKLNTLILFSNKKLKKIDGLEKLKHLKTIIIVGNKIKQLPKLKTILENTKNCKMFKLDISLYPYLNKDDISSSENKKLEFAEEMSVGQMYNLTQKMMEEEYEIALEIIKNNTNPEDTVYEKIRKIYNYIIDTTTYDYHNLEQRDNFIIEGNEIEIYSNNHKHINSSYTALKEHNVVCEGYANAFKFLLNIIGVEAENIVCFIYNGKPFEFFNHTASRVKFNEQWLYCDVQRENPGEPLKYFMLSKEEFEKTHKFEDDKRKQKWR